MKSLDVKVAELVDGVSIGMTQGSLMVAGLLTIEEADDFARRLRRAVTAAKKQRDARQQRGRTYEA